MSGAEFGSTMGAMRTWAKRTKRIGIGVLALGAAGFGGAACGSEEPSADGSSGGDPSTGGVSESGGAPSSGGLPNGGSAGEAGGGAGGGESGGSGGGSGSDSCHQPSAAGDLITRLPCLLSETGLYQADMETLGEGVRPYSPLFELWSDSASKRRWIWLPPDAQIDSTEMDYWSFPAGTKLWKEFTREGVRVETRLIQKQPSGVWYTVAYHWRSDQREADAVPNGVVDASGTPHDIPSAEDCLTCHSQMPDKVLGFSAIQLAHEPLDASDPLEWTLDALKAEEVLTESPAEPLTLPGTDIERAFFGYLHANCGHCHNPRGTANAQTGLDMWLKVADLAGPVTEFSVYKSLYDVDIVWEDGAPSGSPRRVAPGSLEESAVYRRFVDKGEAYAMPPLATDELDEAGRQAMEAFIESLESP